MNPFLPLAGYFPGEFERRVSQNASVAICGAHVEFDDIYTSVDVKLRLYPQDRVLENLGVSAGVGYGSATRFFIDDDNSGGIQRVVPTLRVTIGYALYARLDHAK